MIAIYVDAKTPQEFLPILPTFFFHPFSLPVVIVHSVEEEGRVTTTTTTRATG